MMPTITIFSTALLALAGISDAFWRMECRSRTGLARIDPLVEPGRPASHSHTIHGGSNFGFNTTYEDLMASECTSCVAKQDKSAYWTPSLHFVHKNGTIVLVEQVGGMLAYYNLYGKDIVAFPPGFRMLAGDNHMRALTVSAVDKPTSQWTDEDRQQKVLAQKVMSFTCMHYGIEPAEPSHTRHEFPSKAFLDESCKDGIRAELQFPSCWDGENLDSEDHKSHMAYPSERLDGVCPDGFKKRVPTLFFETIWNTNAFKNVQGSFIWSNGDTTGFGYHADFISGWEPDVLQQAIKECRNESGKVEDCPVFDLQPLSAMQKCNFEVPEVLKAEDCVGPQDKLCGDPELHDGEEVLPTSVPVAPGPSIKPPKEATHAPAPTDDYVVPSASRSATPEFSSATPQSNSAAEEPTSAPTAAVTPSPSAPVNSNIISTSVYTSAGTVYEVAIEKVEVTVTVEVQAPEATGPAYHRRHVHHRRDREHGVLGRRHFH